MRLIRSRRTWFAVLVCAAVALPAVRTGHAEADPTALVKRLGNEDYYEREKAAAELKALGEKALPAVREGTASPDPEIRARAHELLHVLLLGVGKSKSTGMELRPVYARAFEMGSPKNEPSRRPDEALHTVRITRAFLVGTYEVTQGEYEEVMKRNPSWFAKTGAGKDKVPADTSRFPVEQVTWFDAREFCNRLSKLDGYEPYYNLADVKTADGAITGASVTVLGGTGYRLPTEAEWEYTCRGGTVAPFHYGRRSTGRDLNAKIFIPGGYGGPSETTHLGRTAKVGSYPRNARGLHDMHGNAGEWCWDWYDRDYYTNSPEADPTGPKEGTHRVLRGGSWLIADTSCRSANRAFHPPGEATNYTGFRVARSPRNRSRWNVA
jgi:formylglycine-generating enzyme required for sulfatase activity